MPWSRGDEASAIVAGQTLVRGGEHVGQVPAADGDRRRLEGAEQQVGGGHRGGGHGPQPGRAQDRKSTRLNSSHLGISYAVFCLKKKKKQDTNKKRAIKCSERLIK